MRSWSIQRAWRRQVESDPDREALSFLDSSGEIERLSGAQLHTEVMKRAGALSRADLEPGGVCVLALPSDRACCEILLGALALGAVPLLVAPPVIGGADGRFLDHLARVAERVGAALVVVRSRESEAVRARLLRLAIRVETAEALDAMDGEGLPAVSGGREIAAYQLTSGTTASPRVCVWTQAQVEASLEGMARAMRLADDDRVFNWTPLYHDMGLVNNFLLCVTRGVPLTMMQPTAFVRRPSLWLRGMSSVGATHSWSPNFGFEVASSRIRTEELAGVRLDRVKAIWNAAEKVHHETIVRFHRRFEDLGLRREALQTNFGCAENVGGATFSTLGSEPAVEWIDTESLQVERLAVRQPPGSVGARPIVSVGRPVPGARIEIRSADGTPLADGHVGEMALYSESAMLGTLGADGEIEPAASPLLTGDLGYVREGRVFWTGRSRETIVLRGRKIDPSELEVAVSRTAGLRAGSFAAFGIEDPDLGTERLVVIAELREGEPASESIARSLRAEVESGLGLAVDRVALVPKGALPKTSSGKRRHLAFRERYLRGELAEAATY